MCRPLVAHLRLAYTRPISAHIRHDVLLLRWPTLVVHGFLPPKLANMGQFWPDAAQIEAIRVHFCRSQTRITFCLDLAEFGPPHRRTCVQRQTNLVKIGRSLNGLGSKMPEFGPNIAQLGQTRGNIGQSWANFGRSRGRARTLTPDASTSPCGGRPAFPSLRSWQRSPSPRWPLCRRLRMAIGSGGLVGAGAFERAVPSRDGIGRLADLPPRGPIGARSIPREFRGARPGRPSGRGPVPRPFACRAIPAGVPSGCKSLGQLASSASRRQSIDGAHNSKVARHLPDLAEVGAVVGRQRVGLSQTWSTLSRPWPNPARI